MFININKYTFSYVTFLIVKKRRGGEHVLLSQTILFSYKNKKKWKSSGNVFYFSIFFKLVSARGDFSASCLLILQL